MNIEQKLYWLMHMGISCFCAEVPRQKATATQTVLSDLPATTQAHNQILNVTDLPALNAHKMDFTLSALKKTASHTLLGQGPNKPKLMCIFEMPSADSDRSGETLSGPQGELFIKMMNAIQLDIKKDIYITYLSPWRTPGNRSLTEAEQALFLPFLTREIDLVFPQKILLFGSSVADALLKIKSLTKARGNWHEFQNIPVRVTLALTALKTDVLKRQAWQDLQEVGKN